MFFRNWIASEIRVLHSLKHVKKKVSSHYAREEFIGGGVLNRRHGILGVAASLRSRPAKAEIAIRVELIEIKRDQVRVVLDGIILAIDRESSGGSG